MSVASRWRNWAPKRTRIIQASPEIEPTKPTKVDSDGFEGAVSGNTQIIQASESLVEPTPEPITDRTEIIPHPPQGKASKPTKQEAAQCPYRLPDGIRLLSYSPKEPPVAVTVCSVVIDVPKFIQQTLGELDRRVNGSTPMKAGDSIQALFAKLEDCGVEVSLIYPPETPAQKRALQEVAGGEPSEKEDEWWRGIYR